MMQLRREGEFDSTRGYFEYLKDQGRKGNILATTVEQATRDEMLARILDHNLLPGLYIEIGPRSDPYAGRTTRRFSEHAQYLGVNLDGSPYIQRAADELIANSENREFARVVVGDGRALDLPSASKATVPVQQVEASDVFLSTDTHHESANQILKEAARVMAPGGFLIIREEDFDPFHEGLAEALYVGLDAAGFGRRAIIHSYDEGISPDTWDDLWRQFPKNDQPRGSTGDTYLIAQLGEPELTVVPKAAAGSRLGNALRKLRPGS